MQTTPQPNFTPLGLAESSGELARWSVGRRTGLPWLTASVGGFVRNRGQVAVRQSMVAK